MSAAQPAIVRLWNGLHGTWQLRRALHSQITTQPSGVCAGTATFTSRTPSMFIDNDGKLQQAQQEMVYSESGEFHMLPTTDAMKLLPFQFTRKYVWRLLNNGTQAPEISIWFVKPGTEEIDYLFHKVQFGKEHATVSEETSPMKLTQMVEGNGCHLCVDDLYNSEYKFHLGAEKEGEEETSAISSWKMLHEVRGPQKDQIIETEFRR